MKTMNPLKWILTLAGLLIAMAGCGMAEQVEELNLNICSDGSANCWAAIQPALFDGTGSCTNCHTGNATAGEGLSWDFDRYAEIVTNGYVATKSLTAGELIVNPGNADTSFVHRKVRGELVTGEGDRMPRFLPALSNGDLDWIDAWINAGAPEN